MELILDYNSTYVRLFFRVYFFLLFLVVSMVGNQCCANIVKVQLLRSNRIQLARMTEWLQNFDPIFALRSLRVLPGGWFWFLMVFSSFLNLGSDFVSTAIQVRRVQSRCEFGTGLVVSFEEGFSLETPPPNGAPYFVVAQSQITSQSNGGLVGIYAKANRDLNFSADASDVLGAWTCTGYQTAIEYPPSVSAADLVADMQGKGYFYTLPDPPYYYTIDEINGGILSTHLVIWDSSAGDTFEQTFDVRAAIDMSADFTDSKMMESFECKLQTMNATEQLENIQRGMLARMTLHQWTEVLPGAVYNGNRTPASNNTQHILEQVLNSMMMIAGGENYLLATDPGNDSQGCMAPQTYVPWEVIALAAVTALLAGFLLLFWLYTLIQIRRFGKKAGRKRMETVKRSTPSDTFTWMVQAVKESQERSVVTRGSSSQMNPKYLREWDFGVQDSGGMGVARRLPIDSSDDEHQLIPPTAT